MSFGALIRPYWDARDALNALVTGEDNILISDPEKGILSTTCNGRGLRRDFAISKANGYAEYIALDDALILTLVSLKSNSELTHRNIFDGSVHFGVQLHAMEEVVPIINSRKDNTMFFGGVSGEGTSERRLHKDTSFKAIDLALPGELPLDNRILDVHVPNIIAILNECSEEIVNKMSFFSHDGAGGPLRQCVYEMLHTEFEGDLKFSYLRAKANEMLCLLEVRSQRLNEKQPAPSYRLSQSDRESLEQVRQYIEGNPSVDLSVERLAHLAGFSANRTTALFKLQYQKTIHQFVVQTRMQKAEKLLVTTELPINDISRAVGYSDLSGFGRAFKKWFGIKPTAVRRN